MTMTCPIDSLDLSLYLDGEIGPIKAARVRRHLARCPRCRARYEELVDVEEALSFVGPHRGLSSNSDSVHVSSAAHPAIDGAGHGGDESAGVGESAAARMPGRRRLSAAEQRTMRRRRRNAIVTAAVIVFAGGALWWSSDVPVKKNTTLFRMGDENRQLATRLLEKLAQVEARLAEVQTAFLGEEPEPETRDAMARVLVRLEEQVTRLRVAARHASAGVLPVDLAAKLPDGDANGELPDGDANGDLPDGDSVECVMPGGEEAAGGAR